MGKMTFIKDRDSFSCMGLGEWIGRRVHNWTTKPFPEGMPSSSVSSGGTSSTNSSPAKFSTPIQPKIVSLTNAQPTPSVSETPKESPEEMAEKVMILIPYIKQYRSQGMLDDEIESFLKEHNWPEYLVRKAIQKA
jgi:hypothetical protein